MKMNIKIKILLFSIIGVFLILLGSGNYTPVKAGDLEIVAGVKMSSGMSNASANGTFTLFDFETYPEIWAARGQVILSGTGTGTYQDLAASDNDLKSGTLTYSANSDGTFTVTVETAQSGIISADGNVFMISKAAETYLGMVVAVKQSSSGMSNASLEGTYIACSLETNPDVRTKRSQITFSGTGTGTYQQLARSDNGDLETSSFTYTVAGNGTFTLTPTGSTETMQGIVSPDQNMFVLTDTYIDASDNHLEINIGVKKSSGMSVQSATGTYIISDYMVFPEGTRAAWAQVIFDGSGNAIDQDLAASDGDLWSGSFTYSIADDGTVSVNNGKLQGILSADQNVFVLVKTKDKAPDMSFMPLLLLDE
jgi:hypothetical protein